MVGQINILKSLDILGWMSERELIWLATQAQKYNTIVEFGSFRGRSTRALADNTDGVIYAVDPWNGDYPGETGNAIENVNTYVYPQFKQNLRDHIDSGRVVPFRGYSNDFTLDDNSVGMVFIDGDHNRKAVVDDIYHALRIIKPGGLICGHDYNNPGWPAVKQIVDNYFPIFGVEDTIWWTVKS